MISSYCGPNNGCVDVEPVVLPMLRYFVVTDTKQADGPELAFLNVEWQQFLRRAKAGEFDLAS